MARTSGNKPENAPAPDKNHDYDNEDLFLSELLRSYAFWKGEAAKRKEAGGGREEDYAEAYKILLNKFTQIEGIEHE